MIEAMKLALEALEHAAECVQNNSCPAEMGHDWDKQIQSLRNAIAEADKQERFFCERCGKRLSGGIHTCTPPAEAEKQEPVACPYPCGWNNLLSIIIKKGAYLATSTLGDEEPLSEYQRQEMMLMIGYAKTLASWGKTTYSPKQWVGLTDEEIEDEWERITGHSIFGCNRTEGRTMYLSPDEVIEFAQAIEAAHGIKENT